MTEQITVPKSAWDAVVEALERAKVWRSIKLHKEFFVPEIDAALTAANAVSEQPKPVALQWVAEMIMSDCGCSTNNDRLLERVIGRIEQYERANAPVLPQATAPQARGERLSIDVERKNAEREYSYAAHNYPEAPIGSRDWTLYWAGWLARSTAHPQATETAGWKLVPVIPTEEQWGGLGRDIMMWLDMDGRKTAGSLFKHLECCGTLIPQWLRDEPEMKNLDHVPSKGTRVTIIYRAMLAAAPEAQ